MVMSPLMSTLRLAATATTWLLLLGTPVAWWLTRTRSRRKGLIETVLARPLVLPTAVLAFYLLLLVSARGLVGGQSAAWGGGPLNLSFEGLVVGLVLYALPFVVRPLQAAFAVAGREPLEAAATLGAGPLDRLLTVALPLAWRGLLAATVLGFAHTLGAFAIALMVGANVAGRTRTTSITVDDRVAVLDYASAHRFALPLLVFALATLLLIYCGPRRWRRRPA